MDRPIPSAGCPDSLTATFVGLHRSARRCDQLRYDLRDESFSERQQGGGARLNGDPIQNEPIERPEEALRSQATPTSWGFDSTSLFAALPETACWLQAGSVVTAQRRWISLPCQRGRSAGVFLQPWDAAAGALLVGVAGSRLSDLSGRPFDIRHPEMLASSGHLHQAMINVAAPHQGIRPCLSISRVESVELAPSHSCGILLRMSGRVGQRVSGASSLPVEGHCGVFIPVFPACSSVIQLLNVGIDIDGRSNATASSPRSSPVAILPTSACGRCLPANGLKH